MTQPVRPLEKDWAQNPRWKGIKRGYTAEDVVRLRGSVHIEHTLARRGAEKLWNLCNTEPFVNSLGALTGNQAMQQVKAGLKAVYLSGWQVAADANDNGEMYPDQSLYSVDSVPKVVKRINSAFQRADQIQWSEGKNDIDFFAPIVADAEAGFGGALTDARFGDRFWLTLRAEDNRGYVCVSEDGLKWTPKQPWAWENGEPLTMSTTQQHWLVHSDSLFLVYTRKDKLNQNVMRWRAPLYLARVDRKTLRLGAAESVKRVHFSEFATAADWLGGGAQSLYAIRDFVEFKTTWHPIGA